MILAENVQNTVKEIVAPRLNAPIHTIHFQAVGGGSINDT